MKRYYLLVLSFIFITTFASAQTSLFFGYGVGGPAGAGASNGAGSAITNKTVTLADGGALFTPATTVTFSLGNQQYGPGTVQGVPAANGVLFGILGGSTDSSFGITPFYDSLGKLGSPTSAMFTPCGSCAVGSNTMTKKGAISMAVTTDALITDSGANKVPLNAREYMADLIISFNRPVSNPVLHLSGLGGTNSYETNPSTPTTKDTVYVQGFSAEFDIATPGLKLKRLSGSQYLNVTDTSITNAAAHIGPNSQGDPSSIGARVVPGPIRYAASGSVMITGDNITSVTFKVYIRGDGGYVTTQDSNVVAAPPRSNEWSASLLSVNRSTKATRADAFTIAVSVQKPVLVTGTVFNDPDGGLVNNSSGVANAVPPGMHILLVDTSGKVVADTTVATDGTYTFTNVYNGQYTAVLSTIPQSPGNIAVASVPGGWVNTGEYNGTPNSGDDGNPDGKTAVFTVEATDISNINFAIERTPSADLHNTTIPQPSPNKAIVLNGTGTNPPAPSGTDPDDGTYTGGTGTINMPGGVVITSLPINGELWYNGTRIITVDKVIPGFDPGLLEVHLTGTGYTSITFGYAYQDTAGKQGSSNIYSLNWVTPLPVQLISFAGTTQNCNAILSWETGIETALSSFTVMKSADGVVFSPVATVVPKGNDSRYSIMAGNNNPSYYKLQINSTDGKYEYSKIIQLGSDCAVKKITIAPNPTTGTLQISGMAEGYTVRVLDFRGRVMMDTQKVDSLGQMSISSLDPGAYLIQIMDAGNVISSAIISKN